MLKKTLTGTFFILILILKSHALPSVNFEERLTLNPGKYSLILLINKLNEVEGINIVYDANTLPLQGIVELHKANPSVSDVLFAMRNYLNIEYSINGEYVILQPQKQKPKFNISGTVIDSSTHKPLANVNIYVENINYATISKEDGTYSLTLPKGHYIIVYKFIGYREQKKIIDLENDLEADVQLSVYLNPINEVRVLSKRHDIFHLDIGRPVQSIEAIEIENLNINNASDILVARLTGIWAVKSSGMPGDHVNIRIRGINSLFGSVDPLYVVDNVPVPVVNLNTLGIADLNIHDIDNIKVLKDASSCALYGFQGGNGVIMVETKKGTKEKHIEFTSKFGLEYFNKRYDLMNTRDFLTSMDSSYSKGVDDIRQYYPAWSDTLLDEDMQDKLFKAGIIKEYQLSGSGTGKGFKYYLSGNFYDHTGVVVNSGYTRYSVAANIEKYITKKIAVSLGYRGSIQNNTDNLDTYNGNVLIFEGITKSPCIKSTPLLIFERNYYTYYSFDGYTDRNYYDYYSIYSRPELTDSLISSSTKSENIQANMFRISAKYLFSDNLFINASSNLSYRKIDFVSDICRYQYIFGYSPQPPYIGALIFDDLKYLDSKENIVVFDNEFTLNWQKKLYNHNLNLVAGYKNYTDNIYWNVDSTSQPIDNFNVSNEVYIRNSSAIHGPFGSVIRNINSFKSNFIYSYKQKYFLSLAANYEMLKEGLHVDFREFFPSVAINWDIAKENFLINRLSWVNHIMLRADWGRSGNYPLNGQSNDLYGRAHSFNGTTIDTGLVIRQFGNYSMKPELIEEQNVGVSFDLFKNNRVIVSADFFHKTNSNLIIQREIPEYYGSYNDAGKIFLNIGIMENKGKEFTLELIPVLTNQFIWYSRFNLSTTNQIITKLDDNQVIYFAHGDTLYPDFEVDVNSRLGNIIGYKVYGPWTDADQEEWLNHADHPSYINVGGYKVLNADTSDIEINDNDMVALGSSIPSYIWNWYNTFSYKNFSVDFIWYASMGISKYNASRAATYASGTNREINSLLNDTITFIRNPVFYKSSFFVEDASFVRLKQLTFSYQPKKKIFNTVRMKFSLSFENLITISQYKGYDPEAAIYTDNSFSDNAIDRGAFPNPRAFYMSISLKL